MNTRGAKEIAQELGRPYRRVWALLTGEHDTLSWDTADKIVVTFAGPMAWHEDPELREIYESFDLNSYEYSYPVSDTVREQLRRRVVHAVQEHGTQVKAAMHLGITPAVASKYARMGEAVTA